MSFYQRRLPHWHPENTSIFLTWRLYGSLPRGWEPRAPGLQTTPGRRFVETDRLLDRALHGPTWLKNPSVAQCVIDTLHLTGQHWELFELFAWVVMSNHVHALLLPHKPLREVTRAVKGTSGREANRILGRSGQPFWQDESYDHWVRDQDEFNRIIRYIEQNPVSAGLVGRIKDWRWSSATGI